MSVRSPQVFGCCCLVVKSCLTLCNTMNCSTPGFPVLHYLPEFAKFMSIELVMPSIHLILCHPFSSCPQSFPVSESFLMSQLFVSSGQSIGISASVSVLPENIQCWFPLGLCLVDNSSNYQTKQYSVVQMDIYKYGKSTQFWMEILNTKVRLVIPLWMRGRREWDGMRKLNNWYLPLQLTLFSTLLSARGGWPVSTA